MTLIERLTDDFVSTFGTDYDYKDVFAMLVAERLPEGVDPNDARVKAIVQRCKKAVNE